MSWLSELFKVKILFFLIFFLMQSERQGWGNNMVFLQKNLEQINECSFHTCTFWSWAPDSTPKKYIHSFSISSGTACKYHCWLLSITACHSDSVLMFVFMLNLQLMSSIQDYYSFLQPTPRDCSTSKCIPHFSSLRSVGRIFWSLQIISTLCQKLDQGSRAMSAYN